jgi:hypothetical protein
MIFVSSETGSKHLVDPLRKAGLPVEDPIKLDYADVEFSGRGIKGAATSVGVEIKHVSELTSDWDRLCGEQIPKMLDNYDHRWLVYEGEWIQDRQGRLLKRGKHGRLVPHHGQNNAASLRKKLLTLEMCAGMHVHHTKDVTDTVRFLRDLFRWWTDEDIDKHKSHIVSYTPTSLLRHSDFVEAVGRWPGVGLQRAKAADKFFKGNVRRAAMAGLHEWAAIETVDDDKKTRKIGLKTAARIVDFLEGNV